MLRVRLSAVVLLSLEVNQLRIMICFVKCIISFRNTILDMKCSLYLSHRKCGRAKHVAILSSFLLKFLSIIGRCMGIIQNGPASMKAVKKENFN